jgi:hypothetical protein
MVPANQLLLVLIRLSRQGISRHQKNWIFLSVSTWVRSPWSSLLIILIRFRLFFFCQRMIISWGLLINTSFLHFGNFSESLLPGVWKSVMNTNVLPTAALTLVLASSWGKDLGVAVYVIYGQLEPRGQQLWIDISWRSNRATLTLFCLKIQLLKHKTSIR